MRQLLVDRIRIGKPLLMGVLNVTPDSFSDGGSFCETESAIRQGLNLAESGADIIDVGGESTRPGSDRVSAVDQIKRTELVVRRLRKELPASVYISIDTTLSEVARAAINSGADLINDVSGGFDDPQIFTTAAANSVPLVINHMKGQPSTMQADPHYFDVVTEVSDFLINQAHKAEQAGVAKENIILDPGIGFGKTKDHNLKLLAHLSELTRLGYPVLLGTSRKRFMGSICGTSKPKELVGATVATTVLGIQAGVRVFRVHDIAENRQAIDVLAAVMERS
jgi:dihydropteroate synthase